MLAVRFVPEWFPGGGFKRAAKEHKARMAQIDEIPHDWVKEQMVSSPRRSLYRKRAHLHSGYGRFHPLIYIVPSLSRKWQ